MVQPSLPSKKMFDVSGLDFIIWNYKMEWNMIKRYYPLYKKIALICGQIQLSVGIDIS